MLRRRKAREFGLAISAQTVTLTEGTRSLRQVPRGLEPGVLDYLRMLDTIRRERADRLFLAGSQQTRLSPQQEIGELLFDAYLAGPVGERLTRAIARGQEVRIGLVVDPELAGYPWEATVPGAGEEPLVLRPCVTLFRLLPGPRPWPTVADRFTVVAAIAQPSDVRLPAIDHERELDALGAALSDAARFGNTELRVSRSGTAEAIRQSLDVPCQILHLACHGQPGKLVLEAPDCASQPVGPATLTDQILGGPDGRPRVPFIALMGCSTAVSGTADREAANDPTNHETVANLALALMNAGAHGVLATSAVVGDRYLNLFTRHWYAALLGGKTADPAAACAAARREVEHHRRELPDNDPDATRLRDWSAPVLFLREGATSLPGWPTNGSAPGKFTVTGRRQPRPLPSGPAPVPERDRQREEVHKLSAAGRLDEADALATDLAAALHRDGYWDAERDVAADALEETTSPTREAYWSRRLGILHRLRGEPALAARMLARSLWLARRTGDRNELMVSHGEFGILAQDLGYSPTARRHLNRALAFSRELADQSRTAVSLLQLGNIDFLEGAYATAREGYEAAFQIYRQLGDERGIAAGLVQLAMVDADTGRLNEALAGYGEAMRMRATVEDRFNLGQARHQLAILLARRGATGKALDLWRESIAAGMTTGAWELVASGYHQIAVTLQRERQDPSRIAEYYRRAALLEDQLANPQRAATICYNFGQLQQERGDYHGAERGYAKAVQLSGEGSVTAALAVFQLGVLAEVTHRRRLALQRCEEALHVFESAGLREEAAIAQCQIGVLQCRDGDVQTGTEHLLHGYGLLAAGRQGDGSRAGGRSAEHIARTLDYLRLARRSLGGERFATRTVQYLGAAEAGRLDTLLRQEGAES
jgi:tetratricopeptide (TPR) repeat protein